MFSIGLLLIIIGFYFFYCTSKRALLRKDKITSWLHKNAKFSKIIGFLLLMLSFNLFIENAGLAAGILVGVTVLMTVSSLVIILLPFSVKQ